MFKWGERYPDFWLSGRRIERSFNEILSRKHLEQYNNVSIYGINIRIYELISEIRIQCPETNICGIVDPDDMYSSVMGIRCVNIETVLKESDCILLLDEYGNSDIRYKLESLEIKRPDVIDLYDIMPDERLTWFPELECFKDIHKGDRCFIIGNGPSLKSEDLDILHNYGEICFGVNRIDLMYDKTPWRADYFVSTGIEQACIDNVENHLKNISGDKFIPAWYRRNTRFTKDDSSFNYFFMQPQFRNYDVPNHHGFSDDITKRLFECYTVIFAAFQIAAYMGFSEIYLLGIDNGGKGHFYEYKDCDNAVAGLGLHHSIAYLMQPDWEEAEMYSRSHGFRVYNATRGGALEVFERVSFDSLF